MDVVTLHSRSCSSIHCTKTCRTTAARTGMPAVLFTVCLAVLCAASCAHQHRNAVVLPELDQPAVYIRHLLETAAECDRLSGIIRIKASSPGKKLKTKCLFFVEKPDCFRFEMLGFLNQTALLLVSDGENLSMYMPQENRLYTGTANRKNIAAVMSVPLLNAELVSLLMGVPPVETIDDLQTDCRTSGSGVYLCDIVDNGRRHRIWIEPRLNRISGYAFYDNGREQYSVTFAHDGKTDVCAVPSSADIACMPGHTDISVSYDSVSRHAFSQDVFSFLPPSGASISTFDELFVNGP